VMHVMLILMLPVMPNFNAEHMPLPMMPILWCCLRKCRILNSVMPIFNIHCCLCCQFYDNAEQIPNWGHFLWIEHIFQIEHCLLCAYDAYVNFWAMPMLPMPTTTTTTTTTTTNLLPTTTTLLPTTICPLLVSC
jgi:hypothetical protein